jgi:MFS family permease
MGRARSMAAVGRMTARLAGGILADRFGPRPVFVVLGCVALAAPLFAAELPTTPEADVQRRPRVSLRQIPSGICAPAGREHCSDRPLKLRRIRFDIARGR